MRGIFSLLAIFAIAMVVFTGVGVLGLSQSTLNKAKQQAATDLATGIAYGVSAQMALLEQSVEQLATDDEVILAIESADPAWMEKVSDKVQKVVPNALKIRLLPANVNAIDETTVPNMGYADLYMVKKTLTAKQPAIIQGEGENRHLAITAPIKKQGQVIGVVLASLKFDFIKGTLDNALIKDSFIEISQENVVLESGGDKTLKNDAPQQISTLNTPWKISYWSTGARDFADIGIIMGVVVFFALLMTGALFYGYWQMTVLLKKDQNKVLEAVKDLMTGKELGGYQVSLTEMQIIISTLAQFKRILDNKQSRSLENQGQVKLEDRDVLDLAAQSSVANKKSFASSFKKKK